MIHLGIIVKMTLKRLHHVYTADEALRNEIQLSAVMRQPE